MISLQLRWATWACTALQRWNLRCCGGLRRGLNNHPRQVFQLEHLSIIDYLVINPNPEDNILTAYLIDTLIIQSISIQDKNIHGVYLSHPKHPLLDIAQAVDPEDGETHLQKAEAEAE